MSSNYLVPYWQDDPDYYAPKDNRRSEHIASIKRRKRVEGMINAAGGDKSYSIILPGNFS